MRQSVRQILLNARFYLDAFCMKNIPDMLTQDKNVETQTQYHPTSVRTLDIFVQG
jgi:hypothetical protein